MTTEPEPWDDVAVSRRSRGTTVEATDDQGAAPRRGRSVAAGDMVEATARRDTLKAEARGRGDTVKAESKSIAEVKKDPKGFDLIVHRFNVAHDQIETGLRHCNRVVKYLTSILKAKDTYAKEIMKITSAEAASKANDDPMKRSGRAWITMREKQGVFAIQEMEYCAKVTAEVINPMANWIKEAETRRKNISTDERNLSNQIKANEESVSRAYSGCVKQLQSLREAEEETKKKQDEAAAQALAVQTGKAAPGSSLWNSIKNRASSITGPGDENELRDKAYTAAVNYDLAIQAANEKLKSFYAVELPKLLVQLQALEGQRLDVMKDLFAKLGAIDKATLKPREEQVSALIQGVESMDSGKDITDFVDSTLAHHGKFRMPDPFEYDLGVPPEEIKKKPQGPQPKKESKQANPKSVFGNTLATVMKNQAEKYGDMETPLIVPTLIKAVRDLNGIKTEGIFRLSASKDQVAVLRTQMDSGDFSIKTDGMDVHVASCLLKEWLRELPEPLLPNDLYEKAVAVAKLEPDKVKDTDALAVYNAFPPVNKAIVDELAHLLHEIQANHEQNRMTYDNLAIVFGPCVLRHPSRDPITMLTNAKHESRFVRLMFAALGKNMS